MVFIAEAVISFTYLHIVLDFIDVHSYAPGNFCYHLLCFGYQYQRSVYSFFSWKFETKEDLALANRSYWNFCNLWNFRKFYNSENPAIWQWQLTIRIFIWLFESCCSIVSFLSKQTMFSHQICYWRFEETMKVSGAVCRLADASTLVLNKFIFSRKRITPHRQDEQWLTCE